MGVSHLGVLGWLVAPISILQWQVFSENSLVESSTGLNQLCWAWCFKTSLPATARDTESSGPHIRVTWHFHTFAWMGLKGGCCLFCHFKEAGPHLMKPGVWSPRSPEPLHLLFFLFTGRTSTSNTRRENGDALTTSGCAYLWVIIQKENIRVCLGFFSALAGPVVIMELSLKFNTHKNTEKWGWQNPRSNK